MPDNKWKQRWSVYVGLLLIYTAIFVPLRIAFYEETTREMLIFETFIDMCFITDIVVNFFSAYEKKNNVIETRKRHIAIDYLKGWFFIDAISSVPF